MPGRKTKKSPQLKQIEAKLKIVKAEIARRKNVKNKKRKQSSGSSDTSRNAKKSTKSAVLECQRVLKHIKGLKFATEFLEPFDWKKAGCLNYLDYIPNPMDLSRVQQKLDSQEYRTIYEFAYDVHLTLANAMCYNFNSKEPIYKDSMRLHTKFMDEFSKLVEQCETSQFTLSLVRILIKIFKLDHCVIFKYPVPYEAMQLPNYRQVVTKPMDLGTVFKRIHLYNDFRKFMDDINLTFDNCMKFNPKGNIYHSWGEEVKGWARKYARNEFTQEFQRYERGSSPIVGEPSRLQLDYSNVGKEESSPAAGGASKSKKSKNKSKSKKSASHADVSNNSNNSNSSNNANNSNNSNNSNSSSNASNASDASDASNASNASNALNASNSMSEAPGMSRNDSDSSSIAHDALMAMGAAQPAALAAAQAQEEGKDGTDGKENDNEIPWELQVDLDELENGKYSEEQQDHIIRTRFLHKSLEEIATVNDGDNSIRETKIESLNYEQQTELQKGALLLDHERLNPLLQIFHDLAQENNEEIDNEEIELDIERIPAATQVEMYIYVCQAIKLMEDEKNEREAKSRTSVIEPKNLYKEKKALGTLSTINNNAATNNIGNGLNSNSIENEDEGQEQQQPMGLFGGIPLTQSQSHSPSKEFVGNEQDIVMADVEEEDEISGVAGMPNMPAIESNEDEINEVEDDDVAIGADGTDGTGTDENEMDDDDASVMDAGIIPGVPQMAQIESGDANE